MDRAIGALQELKQEIPDLKKKMQWYIIGNGPDYESIKKLISDLELADIIILLGEQKNPYQFYEKMDCFFFPLYITTDEHMRPEHLYYKEVNSKDGNYYRRWASAIGTAMSELIDEFRETLRDFQPLVYLLVFSPVVEVR